MLTLQLRELEEDQVIIRKVYPEVPPKVEYSLSNLGHSLQPILLSLREWGSIIMQKIQTDQQ
jgi:DNA-binding HxlR family transcriptional regulator